LRFLTRFALVGILCSGRPTSDGTVTGFNGRWYFLQITKTTNGFQIAKPSWAGSAGTIQVTLQRPHSILMPNI